MKWDIVVCDGCGEIYTGQVGDQGRIALPTEGQGCARCGSASLSPIDRMVETDDDRTAEIDDDRTV